MTSTASPIALADPSGVHMRWYPLLRRIAREVDRPLDGSADGLTRRLYAAYFHGHSCPDAWPPRTDAGTLCPTTEPDDEFVARLTAAVGRERRQRPLLGYFAVHGDVHTSEPAPPTVRCYLNLVPETAPAVFARVAHGLDASGVVYAGKLLDNPLNYGRPDAAVFYATRDDVVALVRAALAAHHPRGFGAEVPAFTREIAAGIAVADDPGAGVSFGYHRCRLIADGLLRAGAGDPHDRLGAIIESFLRAGIDPARPHLGPGRAELELEAAA